MAKRSSDTETEVDALFQLPLSEFTAARNALAARLKKMGHTEEAERVKGIQKPPASAWIVNQLYWKHPKDIETLLAVGERFRKAQAAQLAGKSGDLRALLNERRETLATLMTRASGLLRDAGHAVSPESTRRIATTLESLAAWGKTDGAPQAGRLTDDLEPPGFEALAALVPRPGGGKNASEPSKLLPFRNEPRARGGKQKRSAEDQTALRARARETVQAAEKALRDAQRDAAHAEAMLKQAAARAKAAEKEKREIEKVYEQLQVAAQAASKEARRVAEQAEEAAQAVTDAERELEKARAALAEYS
jgi:DNA repair exonuclease SbcCD ATPase subunit